MAEVVGFAFVSMAPRCLRRIYFHAAHEISDSTFLVLLHGTSPFSRLLMYLRGSATRPTGIKDQILSPQQTRGRSIMTGSGSALPTHVD